MMLEEELVCKGNAHIFYDLTFLTSNRGVLNIIDLHDGTPKKNVSAALFCEISTF